MTETGGEEWQENAGAAAELDDIEAARGPKTPEGAGQRILDPLLERADDVAVVVPGDPIPILGFQGRAPLSLGSPPGRPGGGLREAYRPRASS